MIIFQKGFNWSQDGPGNRLVYHMRGCNLRCPWCANPEGMALARGGESISTEAIVVQAQSARAMFFGGGGVTFTGGEPTVQFDALRDALQALKAAGINTAIETNGTHPALHTLYPWIDHLMMDIKHPNAEVFRRVTGGDLAIVLANARAARDKHPDVWIRTPVVGGFNATEADMRALFALFKSLSGEHTRFELLRYHAYGADKWRKLGLRYEVAQGDVAMEDFQRYQRIMWAYGLRVAAS